MGRGRKEERDGEEEDEEREGSEGRPQEGEEREAVLLSDLPGLLPMLPHGTPQKKVKSQ